MRFFFCILVDATPKPAAAAERYEISSEGRPGRGHHDDGCVTTEKRVHSVGCGSKSKSGPDPSQQPGDTGAPVRLARGHRREEEEKVRLLRNTVRRKVAFGSARERERIFWGLGIVSESGKFFFFAIILFCLGELSTRIIVFFFCVGLSEGLSRKSRNCRILFLFVFFLQLSTWFLHTFALATDRTKR